MFGCLWPCTPTNISVKLATDLRLRGYEAISALEARHIGWEDDEHLAYAAEHEMAVLTFDMRFVRTAEQWAQSGREFWGVILAPQFGNEQYGILLQWTLEMLDRVTSDELRNTVVFLRQFQRNIP